jgi:glutamate synthase domain-containing protein 1
MCGIVGLFSKSSATSERLGEHLAGMLVQLSARGPDSAGVAVYRDPAPSGTAKLTLHHPDPAFDWIALARDLGQALGDDPQPDVRASHAVLVVASEAAEAQDWVARAHPEVRVMSAGEEIEIYKEMGSPERFAERFALRGMEGSHGLGHTRMATESRVTTEHSHPFSTGLDLCLVHNGSLSNHNRLRRDLRRAGIAFQTDNDSEVAAGYLTWRLREGASLEHALEGCLRDLDGFYTFAVGTRDGFAVLRDPIACKPAVMAENDDWVAIASEYRAIAVLPGADDAEMWEPAPATVYSWERQRV